MGVDTLNSITYSGTARNGAFGQSKSIGEPMGPVNVTQITQYTRTINFGTGRPTPTALVSRATGPTQPPTVPGVPAPMPGVFNQNITGTQASTNWDQALNIWTTPWGFLKGAAANNATVRQQGGQQVVSFSPAEPQVAVGADVHGDRLHQQPEPGDQGRDARRARRRRRPAGRVRVLELPEHERRAGADAASSRSRPACRRSTPTITAATPNPPNLAELLTPPPPAAPAAPPAAPPAGRGAGRGAPQAAAGPPPVEKLGEGVFKIGGNYTSLAVDMGDHILVVESGQSDARGMAVMAAAKQAIPNKPIRFVVNSHPHFDHASGLAAAVAEGATILTHRNNEQVLERLLSGPRTLTGDSLSKVSNRRTNVVEGVGDRDVRKGTNGKVVELHRIPNEHSDGMLAVYLPAEKVAVDGGHHRRESQPRSARRGQVGGRGAQPAEARLQRVDSGAPAEPGQAADEGGRDRGGGSGESLTRATCYVLRATCRNVRRATCDVLCHVRNAQRTARVQHVARARRPSHALARSTWRTST